MDQLLSELTESARHLVEDACALAHQDRRPLTALQLVFVELQRLRLHVLPELPVPSLSTLMDHGGALTALRVAVHGQIRHDYPDSAEDPAADEEQIRRWIGYVGARRPINDVALLAGAMGHLDTQEATALREVWEEADSDLPAKANDLDQFMQELRDAASGPSHSKADSLLRRVSASHDHRYAPRHREVTSPIINYLSRSQEPEFVIAKGEYGSPIDRLEEALADLFDQANYLGHQGPRVNNMRSIAVANAAALVALDPSQIVPTYQRLCAEAANSGAVLALRRLEILGRRNSAGEEALRQALANPGRALVLGVYETNSPSEDIKPHLGPALLNAQIIEVPVYAAKETQDFIQANYVADWREEGFSLAPDTLDVVFALANGIEDTRQRHRRLPYLPVGIIKEVIDTLKMPSDRETFMKEKAMQAAIRAESLEKEAKKFGARGSQYVEIFGSLLTGLQALAKSGRVARVGGHQEISSALVMAHVLSSASMQVRIPL